MDSEIIDRMRREEADLKRKLDAVRALLIAYGEAPLESSPITSRTVLNSKESKRSSDIQSSGREKMPLERFSTYGQSIVKAAIEECFSHIGKPIPSREMVDLVEKRGVQVRGDDKGNALSALLARSADLKANGRKGWTLSEEYLERNNQQIAELFGEENEPHSANAGGSKTALDAQNKETTEW